MTLIYINKSINQNILILNKLLLIALHLCFINNNQIYQSSKKIIYMEKKNVISLRWKGLVNIYFEELSLKYIYIAKQSK